MIRKALYALLALVAIIMAVPLFTHSPADLMRMGQEQQARDAANASVLPAKPVVAPPSPANEPTTAQQARWACSREVEARAKVPESVEWVRRSTWGAIEVEPKVWVVQANYVAKNAFGTPLAASSECRLRLNARGGFDVLTFGRALRRAYG